MNKTSKTILIVLSVIVGILLITAIGSYRYGKKAYNNMVIMDEDVASKWSQVENVYQRRADLIPNLVNTVKGYAEHEQETFTQVIEAMPNTNVKPSRP